MFSSGTTHLQCVLHDATCAQIIISDLPQHCQINKYILCHSHFGTSGRVTQQVWKRRHKNTKQRKQNTVCDLNQTSLRKTIIIIIIMKRFLPVQAFLM